MLSGVAKGTVLPGKARTRKTGHNKDFEQEGRLVAMPLENCTLCRGTGWKLVPRQDGAAGSVAVACDCGMEERASRVMERARIPKRYQHCDFESYVTDLTDGKTWTAQHAHSLKQAKLFTQGFVREYPGSFEKGLLFMGPSGVGKTHLAVAALKELIHRGHAGLFCDYRELLKEIQASYNPANESTEILRHLERYLNVPMSFADACLVRMCEIDHDAIVFTTDRDFLTYRRNRRQPIPLISPF